VLLAGFVSTLAIGREVQTKTTGLIDVLFSPGRRLSSPHTGIFAVAARRGGALGRFAVEGVRF